MQPQVSRQTPRVGLKQAGRYKLNIPIHCHAWTYLSIVTLKCTSSAKRFPPKIVNEKKFLSIESLTFILTKNQSDYSMILEKPYIFFFSSSFNISFQRVQTCYHYFCCFNVFSQQTFLKNYLIKIQVS